LIAVIRAAFAQLTSTCNSGQNYRPSRVLVPDKWAGGHSPCKF